MRYSQNIIHSREKLFLNYSTLSDDDDDDDDLSIDDDNDYHHHHLNIYDDDDDDDDDDDGIADQVLGIIESLVMLTI